MPANRNAPPTRRDFVRDAALLTGGLALPASVDAVPPAPEAPAVQPADSPDSRQATGVRVGEVTDTTAIVWVRLTAQAARNDKGPVILGKGNTKGPPPELPAPVDDLHGACPGAPGKVRVRYGTREDLADARSTDWAAVTAEDDYIRQFPLRDLRPGTVHHYATETAAPDGRAHAPLRGRFETAPAADATGEVRFCVMTCQGYPDRGHPDGHGIYPSMLEFRPRFACLTGDLVYYDNDAPRAVTARLARYHWERMFSLPRLRRFTQSVATYWLKDDHDILNDDSWPGRSMGEMTFDEGRRIFRRQAPLPDGPAWRTVRWGRDLQVWFSEGRDHRTPNNRKDGPDKTIWGPEQTAWFHRTVKDSDATWKILVTPTPIVGPDRTGKNDNHANAGFRTEGDAIRQRIRDLGPDRLIVVCGDRHWQYHSVDPATGVREFSVGPASDEHAGGTPGENKDFHRFHRVCGGFLAVTVGRQGDESKITFELRGVAGRVNHSWSSTRRPG